MDINGFCYERLYISFPIDPIDLKLTEGTHGDVVNIHTEFEAILTK